MFSRSFPACLKHLPISLHIFPLMCSFHSLLLWRGLPLLFKSSIILNGTGSRLVLTESHKAITIDKKQFRQFLYLTDLCGGSPCVKVETRWSDLASKNSPIGETENQTGINNGVPHKCKNVSHLHYFIFLKYLNILSPKWKNHLTLVPKYLCPRTNADCLT